MSQRASHHVCVSCRRRAFHAAKQDTIRPLSRGISTKRPISTTQSSQYAAVTNVEERKETQPLDGVNLNLRNSSTALHEEDDATPLDVKLHQARLYSPIDDLREQLFGGFRAYQRFEHLQTRQLQWQKATPYELGRISAQDSWKHTYSHQLMWENVEEYKSRILHQLDQKSMRKLITDQLKGCRSTRDVLQIVAVAMQRRESAIQISKLPQEIISALYRARQSASDPSILSALNLIINRIRKENLPVQHAFILDGLRFAARSRSLPAMKRYLRDAKTMDVSISGTLFRSVIAKFSIGSNGLGEIRNGRWKRENLLQVLLGFEGVDAANAYHLGAFLNRDDWDSLSGWVAVLARCKAIEEIWKEWEQWRISDLRISNKESSNPSRLKTTRIKRDAWFIEQLLHAEAHERAWQILYETEMPLDALSIGAKIRLMDHPEHVREWDEPMKQALMVKYEAELKKIEQALGVKWISQGEEGFHLSLAEGDAAEEIMEKLSDLSTAVVHGYPED
ncbi:MAG: hypothetical protein M1822_004746 [Bathelium mastoideum]|nr:MAG: hypothetical protein M1822_004746 [Bathelium mastoideum]